MVIFHSYVSLPEGIFIGGYQPPPRAKATYFFVPQNDFAQQRCGNFIQQGWQPEGGKSGRSGLMRVPKDGEQHQQMYFFLVQQPQKDAETDSKPGNFWKK